MIVHGRLDRILSDKTSSIVSFAIPSYQANYLAELTDDEYKIEITVVKSKRTWELIGRIAKSQGMESDEVYCQIIKMAKIKTVHLETIEDALPQLEKLFRVVVKRDERTSVKGVKTIVCEAYFGSSTFDQSEMSEFIDRMLDYAEKSGIDTSQYELR
jgi:DNA-directed RNA polymerase subunit F